MSADDPKPADPKPATPKPAPNSKNDQLDVYVLRSIYPEAAAVFQPGPKPLALIKDNCLVVVDTNALLLPYTTSREDLAEIVKTYTRLVGEDRFFVPAQVSREFAKNRANKITDLYNALSQKQGTQNQFTPRGYPLLNEFPDYQRVMDIAQEIEEKRKEYQKALKAVVDHVQGWTWNDPVSTAYAEVFTDRNVIEAEISEDDFRADCLRRQTLSIPPGFKDESNGDLMIWHTILEIGKKYQKNLLFVSADEKTDWRLRSNGGALYPRFELVDEYRRASGGGSFHIVRLSELLDLFGAEPKAVQEVERREEKGTSIRDLISQVDFQEIQKTIGEVRSALLVYANTADSHVREERVREASSVFRNLAGDLLGKQVVIRNYKDFEDHMLLPMRENINKAARHLVLLSNTVGSDRYEMFNLAIDQVKEALGFDD